MNRENETVGRQFLLYAHRKSNNRLYSLSEIFDADLQVNLHFLFLFFFYISYFFLHFNTNFSKIVDMYLCIYYNAHDCAFPVAPKYQNFEQNSNLNILKEKIASSANTC
jgi:hypothetical protein